MPLAHLINKGWKSVSYEWRVSNVYANDGKTVTMNRTDAIIVGNGVTNLPTLIEAVYISIVGVERYNKSATYFINSKDERVNVFTYVARFLTDKKMKWSLMLYGTPGTGKTCLLQAMHRTIMKLYYNETASGQISVTYVKASALGEILKDEKDRFKKMLNCTVLFIDDLGFSGEEEMVNDYGSKRYPVEEIFENRYDRHLMTICTSNLTKPEFEKHYGQKIFSRFCEMFAFVPLSGQDLRRV